MGGIDERAGERNSFEFRILVCCVVLDNATILMAESKQMIRGDVINNPTRYPASGGEPTQQIARGTRDHVICHVARTVTPEASWELSSMIIMNKSTSSVRIFKVKSRALKL